MAQHYHLILKGGKLQIELMGCTGPVCDMNAQKIREILSLAVLVKTGNNAEYGEVTEAEASVSADAE